MKTETTSPYAYDVEAPEYASDVFWQHDLVKRALYEHVMAEGPSDLRGETLMVQVAEDGLHVTVASTLPERKSP